MARWGGEEFLILCEDTALEEAYRMGEKLRLAVESTPVPTVGKVTVSVGVASYGEGDTRDSIIHRADTALYRAKDSGRNRTVAVKLDID